MKKLLNREQLEKLTTIRLLGYRDALLRCHQTQDWDFDRRYCKPKIAKDTQVWKDNYVLVKEILATRENIKK